jgi:hypothetical protein
MNNQEMDIAETESLSQLGDNNQKRKGGAPKGNKNAQKHGLRMLKRAVRLLSTRALDKRTSTVKALVQWREDLIRDLGGEVSTQQDAIIDVACKTKLILDSVDVWILEQPTLINKRKKSVIAAAKERQIFADALSRYMGQLGLERRHKVETWQDILADSSTVHTENEPRQGLERKTGREGVDR